MSVDVGGKLRALRRIKRLSQRDLAARAGLTHGAISTIEQNRSSPSIATLKKALDALEVTLAEFFAPAEGESGAVFFRADELREITPERAVGGRPRVSLRQVGESGALQLISERYPPGADTGADMLRHDSEEGGVVVSGEIEVTVGERRAVLRAGDAYLFDSRAPHRFRNIGDRDCVIISACAPPSF